MSRAEAHLGVSPNAPSQDEPTLTLEQGIKMKKILNQRPHYIQERQQLGAKVLDMDHAPLSQVKSFAKIAICFLFFCSLDVILLGI